MNLLGQFGPVGGEKGEMIAYFCPSLLFFIFLNRTFKYDFLFFLGGGGRLGWFRTCFASFPFPSPSTRTWRESVVGQTSHLGGDD